MKIAVFSDIHGNYEALKSIIDDINSNDYDEVICLGDAIALGPSSKECLDLIIENNISFVLGNHELYSIRGIEIDKNMKEDEKKHHYWIDSLLSKDNFDFLKNCELKIERSYGKYKFLFEHFLINDINEDYPFMELKIAKTGEIRNLFSNIDADYIFIGHEHKSFKYKNNNTLIDVGSSGCVKDDNTFYTVIEINDDVRVYKKYLKYDRNTFVNKVLNTNYPDREKISKHFFDIDKGE